MQHTHTHTNKTATSSERRRHENTTREKNVCYYCKIKQKSRKNLFNNFERCTFVWVLKIVCLHQLLTPLRYFSQSNVTVHFHLRIKWWKFFSRFRYLLCLYLMINKFFYLAFNLLAGECTHTHALFSEIDALETQKDFKSTHWWERWHLYFSYAHSNDSLIRRPFDWDYSLEVYLNGYAFRTRIDRDACPIWICTTIKWFMLFACCVCQTIKYLLVCLENCHILEFTSIVAYRW